MPVSRIKENIYSVTQHCVYMHAYECEFVHPFTFPQHQKSNFFFHTFQIIYILKIENDYYIEKIGGSIKHK